MLLVVLDGFAHFAQSGVGIAEIAQRCAFSSSISNLAASSDTGIEPGDPFARVLAEIENMISLKGIFGGQLRGLPILPDSRGGPRLPGFDVAAILVVKL